MKKIFSFIMAITLFCCLVFVACSPTSIQQLRQDARQQLSEYFQQKLQQDFSQTNLSKINEYFEQGIININQAQDKNAITQALSEAKSKIAGIKEETLTDNQPTDIVDTNDENYLEFVNDVLMHFVNDLKIEDITKVEHFWHDGSRGPYVIKPSTKTTTTLKSDIAVVYQWLKGLTFVEANEETAEGGTSVSLKVYTSKGLFQIVNATGEDFFWCYGKRYEKHAPIPDIEGEDVSYLFSDSENYCYFTVADKFAISKDYEYDFTDVECKVITDKVIAPPSQYRCQTPIGMLYLYEAKIFERHGVVYEIINDFSFSQIFLDYPMQKPFVQDLSTTTILACEVHGFSAFAYNDEADYPQVEVINSCEEFLAIYPQDGTYDEEFFKTNFVVIVTCYTPHTAVSYSLDGVYQKNNETIIRLIYEERGDGATVCGEYYLIMEFSKSIQISPSTTNVAILHPIIYSTENCIY